MSFLDILYKLLIGPLQLVFEIIFNMAYQIIGHPGWAIVVLSLIVNLLVLPLYRRADAIQKEQKDIEDKLHNGIAHIKKTFSGDERMMMLQTYYRQNNYKPTDVLNSSVSLLLQIPFFIAAYQFLSHLQILQGVSFGPIPDLGTQDALIVIGGLSINALPIIMTLVNVFSSAIYLKGFPFKTKLQLYGMALLFLVLLYNSPAGLVFYWTLNNVFSLVKNLVYKIPVTWKKESKAEKAIISKPNSKVFLLGSMFITVLIGLLIPSTIIAASPQEFVDITYFHNPLWYLVSSLCLAAGTFLIWMRIFYWLASDAGKAIFDKVVWILCAVMLVNYMFFGTDLGILSSNLQYENGLSFSQAEQIVNVLVIAVLAVIMYMIYCKWSRVASTVLLTAVIAVGGMSAYNVYNIYGPVMDAKVQAEALADEMPHFNLSTEGKNVIVFMLDKAMGEYIPYIMNEKPELKEKFTGFTYYSNVISFGGNTNFGTPALFGGYEYTPIEMNRRDKELLVDKHNEALKVMPVLFNDNGYEVTVCDPPYANYQWTPDLSIYDAYPDINAYITEGRFTDPSIKKLTVENNYRNFFCFSTMKISPLFFQQIIYGNGVYNKPDLNTHEDMVYSTQVIESNTIANGISSIFMTPYNVLLNLDNITKIKNDSTNTFLMITNHTTHNPMLLKEPEYIPVANIDNTSYTSKNMDRYELNGSILKMDDWYQIMHYQTNMTSLIKLGEWFDFMRSSGVYDNTRIILVADHGCNIFQIDDLIFDPICQINEYYNETAESFFPLLMVKDFNTEGFVTSDEFMTNADVPILALEKLIYEAKNPFTGAPISNNKKFADNQYVITSKEFDVEFNNGNTFLPSTWFAVKDNIWDMDNWRYIDEVTTMPSELLED